MIMTKEEKVLQMIEEINLDIDELIERNKRLPLLFSGGW